MLDRESIFTVGAIKTFLLINWHTTLCNQPTIVLDVCTVTSVVTLFKLDSCSNALGQVVHVLTTTN